MSNLRSLLFVGVLLLSATAQPTLGEAPSNPFSRGESLYLDQCAHCHGKQGEGVETEYDEPLHGSRSLQSLARLIERTMPEEEPKDCTGEDAQAVAAYIYHAFYSPMAREKLGYRVRIEPARRTAPQFRNAVADLLAHFTPSLEGHRGVDHLLEADLSGEPGFQAEYFQSKGMNKANELKMTRLDPAIAFDYAEGSPAESMEADQFAIIWQGSLFAEQTGFYEFRFTTQNGARLFLNVDAGTSRGKLRDDSSAAAQTPLLDGWVGSGALRTVSGRIFLLGGRYYPVRFEYFKYLEKTGSVKLEWKRPRGIWEVLDKEHVKTWVTPRTFVVPTPFPADDRSLGYERGASVSWAWYEAITGAVVATATEIIDRLPLLADFDKDASKRQAQSKAFVIAFAERAYGRPLTEAEHTLYGQTLFENSDNLESAVRKAVILSLKSPDFLYTQLPSADTHQAFQIASLLALTLWDSIPDAALIQAAEEGHLTQPEALETHAHRMVNHPRTRFKIQGFFDHWLEIEDRDLSKDQAMFPTFNESIIADLRRSLDLFIKGVVWGETSDYRQLLLADYLLLNDSLRPLYAPQESSGTPNEAYAPVVSTSGRRAGVLTHPYLLSAFAYHNNTSPIHRGVFLTRNIVGRSLKPPPMAVAFKDDEFDPESTMREKVTQLTKDSACMSCHSIINPLGFALENFDAVGRWRTHEKDKPVNPISEYVTDEGESLEVRSARDIAAFAADHEGAHQAFVLQLFQHLIKQDPAAYGADTLERLRLQFESDEFNVRSLMVRIATLAAGHRHTPEPEAQ